MNIVEKLFTCADRKATALVCGAEKVSYGELITRADAAAARIARTPGHRVGLDCPNGIEHVILALAIVRAGKCLVPLASELAPRERARLIRETALHAIVDAAGEVRPLSQEGDAGFDEEALTALDPAFIRFSSGTTGCCKGVVLSHERLLERVTAANRGLRIGPDDRVLWILPMAHHFAVSILLYLLNGATTVLENSHLADDVLTAARATGATVLYGAPFHHALLAAESSRRDWPSLRLAVSVAAPLPVQTARAFDQRFGVPLSQALGVIEVGLPLLNVDAPRAKPASVGKPLPDFSVRIEESGELLLRGPGMLSAYLAPWMPSESFLRDGWFRTGDLAQMDADGDVHLLGRAQSVINVAGLKCFPEEIEAVLGELPEVRAVRVFGEPHARVGAVPIAEIVPRDPAAPPNVAKLSAHCRKALARYKVPVDFRFVGALPLTASGKVRRVAAQQVAAEA